MEAHKQMATAIKMVQVALIRVIGPPMDPPTVDSATMADKEDLTKTITVNLVEGINIASMGTIPTPPTPTTHTSNAAAVPNPTSQIFT